MLKYHFKRLPQILGDAKHHFAAGLHLALLQFRHIRTVNADTPRQVRLGNAFGLPPFGYCIDDHIFSVAQPYHLFPDRQTLFCLSGAFFVDCQGASFILRA